MTKAAMITICGRPNEGKSTLTNALVGEKVTIVGWMENMREVGSSLAFVVMRDFYGITQVVIENEEMMAIVKPLNKESTISVTGVVRERSSKNNKIPTGEIEVVPEEIKVLSRCIYSELPFEINRSKDADEAARLTEGAHIRVRGIKSAWSGEVEIVDGSCEFFSERFHLRPAVVVQCRNDLHAVFAICHVFASFKHALH